MEAIRIQATDNIKELVVNKNTQSKIRSWSPLFTEAVPSDVKWLYDYNSCIFTQPLFSVHSQKHQIVLKTLSFPNPSPSWPSHSWCCLCFSPPSLTSLQPILSLVLLLPAPLARCSPQPSTVLIMHLLKTECVHLYNSAVSSRLMMPMHFRLFSTTLCA